MSIQFSNMNIQFSNSIKWIENLDQKEMKYEIKLYQRKECKCKEYKECHKFLKYDFQFSYEKDCIDLNHVQQQIVQFLEQNHSIRITIACSSEYYLISTYDEDEKYFTKRDNFNILLSENGLCTVKFIHKDQMWVNIHKLSK